MYYQEEDAVIRKKKCYRKKKRLLKKLFEGEKLYDDQDFSFNATIEKDTEETSGVRVDTRENRWFYL